MAHFTQLKALQSGNSAIGFPMFLKRRRISCKLAAVQKLKILRNDFPYWYLSYYCCFNLNSLPTWSLLTSVRSEREIPTRPSKVGKYRQECLGGWRYSRVVVWIQNWSDSCCAVRGFNSPLVIPGWQYHEIWVSSIGEKKTYHWKSLDQIHAWAYFPRASNCL